MPRKEQFAWVGMLITLVFFPDTIGLDPKGHEQSWAFNRAGRERKYHGVAIQLGAPELVEKYAKAYGPDLNYKQKIEERRGDWEISMAEKEGHLDDPEL
jgi:hypothetical protein